MGFNYEFATVKTKWAGYGLVDLPKMMKISQVPQKTYDMIDVSYFCSLGELGFKSGKVVHSQLL